MAPQQQTSNEELRSLINEFLQRDTSKMDKEFENCTTPAEKANCNLDAFLEHFFLTNGQPDKRKTPQPLPLEGFENRKALHQKAKEIPGLFTYTGGYEYPKTLCIGWDRCAVVDLAFSYGERDRERIKALGKSEWEKEMEAHLRYLTTQRTSLHTIPPDSLRAFDPKRSEGSYIVKCQEVTNGFTNLLNHVLTLDIFVGKDGSLTANCDFGVIDGMMVLSNCPTTLNDRVSKMDQAAEPFEDDDEARELEECSYGLSRRSNPPKFQSPLPWRLRSIFYALRCYETGEGEIQLDLQHGQLDFHDDECSKFSGFAQHFPFVGQNIEFTGYRVSDTPMGSVKDWDDYSEAQYDYARVARWH